MELLDKDTEALLRECLDRIDDFPVVLAEKLKELSSVEGGRLRSHIKFLCDNGYFSKLGWANNVPYKGQILQKGYAYFQKKDVYIRAKLRQDPYFCLLDEESEQTLSNLSQSTDAHLVVSGNAEQGRILEHLSKNGYIQFGPQGLSYTFGGYYLGVISITQKGKNYFTDKDRRIEEIRVLGNDAFVVNNIKQQYNISDTDKVNIHSTDNSTTYQISANDLSVLETIRTLAQDLDNSAEIIAALDQMQNNVGKKSFAEKYNNFIQSIANHMTVFAPFIPALSSMLLDVYKCTESLRSRKAAQYPSHYGSSRTSRYRDDISKKKVCADCVGLIKGYCWTGGGKGVSSSPSALTPSSPASMAAMAVPTSLPTACSPTPRTRAALGEPLIPCLRFPVWRCALMGMWACMSAAVMLSRSAGSTTAVSKRRWLPASGRTGSSCPSWTTAMPSLPAAAM